MNRHNSISKLVLLSLEKSIDGYVRFEDFAYNPEKYVFSGYPRVLKKASLAQAISRLRKSGFIEFISDDELAFRLTNKGKEKALLLALENPDDNWDEKWRVVSFDIPEKRRKLRDLLRAKLKQWNFIQKQKSLWVTKKDCTKQMQDFIKQVGIKEWVMVFESDSIDF